MASQVVWAMPNSMSVTTLTRLAPTLSVRPSDPPEQCATDVTRERSNLDLSPARLRLLRGQLREYGCRARCWPRESPASPTDGCQETHQAPKMSDPPRRS